MEKEVFPVESVKQKLHTDFIPIRVIEGSQQKVAYKNRTVKENDLISAYQIRGFPGHAWISPKGEYLKGISGFIPVKDFNRQLDFWHKEFK